MSYTRLLSKLAHDDEQMLGNLGASAQNLSETYVRENPSAKLTTQMPSGVEFGKKSTLKPQIWVLTDGRVGNSNQAVALAEKLGVAYQLKFMEYNFLGNLPNFLLKIYPIHIKKQLLQSWEIASLPEIIISAGRRTASLANYLKRKSGDKIKIIQIMRPNLSFSQFELVILPEHDKTPREAQNIVRIIGALNNIQAKMSSGGRDLRINYPKLGQFISVIIGGNCKNYNFSDDNATELATILTNITKNLSHTLFISFSRRTPNSAKIIIKNNLPSATIIYDPVEEKNMPNPYFGMLAEGDYLISTADSISMCSEAASTGKPVYIFCPNNFKSSKHLAFTQQLTKLGIAKILDSSVTYLEKYNYQPLNEVEKIANIVLNRVITKNWKK
jgi:hypothetical protein